MSALSIDTQRQRGPLRIRRGIRAWTQVLGAWILALGLLPVAASALDVHSIQIGRFDDAAQAEQARAAAAETCSPAFVQEDASGGTTAYKVLVGRFPYYGEAWVHMKNLQGQGLYPGSSVATWAESTATSATQAIVLPVDLPFATDGLDAAAVAAPATADPEAHWKAAGLAGLPTPEAAMLAKSPGTMSAAELLAVGLAASDKSVAVPALQRFMANNPSAPELNRVRLRLARLTGASDAAGAAPLLAAVRAGGTNEEKALCNLVDAYILSSQKKRPESMAAFASLANNPALAPSLRLEAMERFARHAHALRDYPTAWLAFEQLEASAPASSTAAEARMQRAACAFELAGRAKGTWKETQNLCESVKSMPGATRQTLATAALMHLEAVYYEGREADALVEAESFLQTYADIARESTSAQVWRGILLGKSLRYDEAQTVLQGLLDRPIPQSEKFGGHEPRARAALWLGWYSQIKGDLTRRDACLGILEKEFPDSRETAKARTLFAAPPPPAAGN